MFHAVEIRMCIFRWCIILGEEAPFDPFEEGGEKESGKLCRLFQKQAGTREIRIPRTENARCGKEHQGIDV